MAFCRAGDSQRRNETSELQRTRRRAWLCCGCPAKPQKSLSSFLICKMRMVIPLCLLPGILGSADGARVATRCAWLPEQGWLGRCESLWKPG